MNWGLEVSLCFVGVLIDRMSMACGLIIYGMMMGIGPNPWNDMVPEI